MKDGRAAAAAAAVAALTFSLYHATLLPGLDLGDTASFQAGIEDAVITPRHAYPQYFALGRLFVRLTGEQPASALNLASAVFGAAACGVLVLTTALATMSVAAGVFAGLLLAASYTFWSQAIIAEVYSLQILFVAASLGALLAWRQRPTDGRLAVFFAVYALSFGNHLGMSLFLLPFTLFVLRTAAGRPDGRRLVVRPRVFALALGIAAAGALQYAWNFSGLWQLPDPPGTLREALGRFWFDVTKADWRESLVLAVDHRYAQDRLAMYWFDLRQQFGVPGIALAVLGTATLVRRDRPLAELLVWSYLVTLSFALTYNVGDTHVFLMPSHTVVAVLAGAGAAWVWGQILIFPPRGKKSRSDPRTPRAPLAWGAVAVLLLYAGWRAADTFPAVDRRHDQRAAGLFEQFTAGLTPEDAAVGVDLGWQVGMGMLYHTRYTRPDLRYFLAEDVVPDFAAFARREWARGREIVVTAPAAARIARAHGDGVAIVADPRVPSPPLGERLQAAAPGAPYVLVRLMPAPDAPLDEEAVEAAARQLGGRPLPRGRYAVMAGLAGQTPQIVAGGDRPFRMAGRVGSTRLTVRIDAWLPADTMRRAGYGHVIAGWRHAATIERGVTFVVWDGEGGASRVEYAGGLFAPLPRYIVQPGPDDPPTQPAAGRD